MYSCLKFIPSSTSLLRRRQRNKEKKIRLCRNKNKRKKSSQVSFVTLFFLEKEKNMKQIVIVSNKALYSCTIPLPMYHNHHNQLSHMYTYPIDSTSLNVNGTLFYFAWVSEWKRLKKIKEVDFSCCVYINITSPLYTLHHLYSYICMIHLFHLQ